MLLIFCIISRFSILVSIIAIIVLQNLLQNLSNQNGSSFNTFINNSLGYCLILIPGYWLYKFAKQQDLGGKIICGKLICTYFSSFNVMHIVFIDTCLTSKILKALFGDKHDLDPQLQQPLSPSSSVPANFKKDLITFLYCFGGLQTSYLVWGVIQEKMMSQVIESPSIKIISIMVYFVFQCFSNFSGDIFLALWFK